MYVQLNKLDEIFKIKLVRNSNQTTSYYNFFKIFKSLFTNKYLPLLQQQQILLILYQVTVTRNFLPYFCISIKQKKS